MENQKKSFSQELCENKALISAANTTDLVSLIDEVNYSEETAQLVAGLTNTSVNYVKDVMEEMKAFNENFSEENYPIFIGALNEILQKNSEEINNNFSEYMKNAENFSEEDANNKIEKLSELISLIDDDVMKDLGTDYVSMVIANSTDTDKDALKNVLDSYLIKVDEDDDVEDKKEEVKDIIDDKGEEMKTELVTEKFNEVFIKKDGQYFKFSDATVSVPAVTYQAVATPAYKILPKSQVVTDAAIRAAIPFGNTAGVITGGKSGRGYHGRNFVGGMIGSTAGAIAGAIPGAVTGNPALISLGANAGAYAGKIGGSAVTAAMQKNAADQMAKQAKFDDSVVVPVAGTVAGAGLGTAVVLPDGLGKKAITKISPAAKKLAKGIDYAGATISDLGTDAAVKTNITKLNKAGSYVASKMYTAADALRNINKVKLSNPKVAIPVVAGTALTGAVVGKKISK